VKGHVFAAASLVPSLTMMPVLSVHVDPVLAGHVVEAHHPMSHQGHAPHRGRDILD
jgi:hypothetical protein